jgi:hypothetical protein
LNLRFRPFVGMPALAKFHTVPRQRGDVMISEAAVN